jgi:hypothetical protein
MRGSTVSYGRFPGTDHLAIPDRAGAAVMAWIAERFEGKAAPSTCP